MAQARLKVQSPGPGRGALRRGPDKITLHLARFATFFRQRYSHDRLSACVRRDVVAWQSALREQGLAPATITTTWPRSRRS